MVNRKWTARITALILCMTFTLGAAGCAQKEENDVEIDMETMEEATETEKETVVDLDAQTDETDPDAAAMDFAVRLFQECLQDGENTLISPLSVLYALSMTANGAENNTLSQMQRVLGMSVDDLNGYLHDFMESSSDDVLKAANSIWIKDEDGLEIREEFIEAVETWYEAQVYQEEFDSDLPTKVNAWVEENTGGLIDEILDEAPEDAFLYLVNALAFDADWENAYPESQVADGYFTMEDGETVEKTFLYSENDVLYLEDDDAVGFVRYYEGQKYAFVALLPDEGVSVADYTASLTGEHLSELLSDMQEESVRTSLPKFEMEYSAELSDALKTMGMEDAFDEEKADFSGITDTDFYRVFIGRVLHKTYLSVDETGTQAGAATAVEMMRTTALEEDMGKIVYLDRPFLYLLIDCDSMTPIFMGALYQ